MMRNNWCLRRDLPRFGPVDVEVQGFRFRRVGSKGMMRRAHHPFRRIAPMATARNASANKTYNATIAYPEAFAPENCPLTAMAAFKVFITTRMLTKGTGIPSPHLFRKSQRSAPVPATAMPQNW
ncbi:hypothetical protein [Leisingera caerulea]|uniref:Uncharacterized protein n=1 Tax=Leisingera caerulea TaxID=506591 RepID=A0A9Q9HJA1_LEICA|nr:hypothetical protein [Leisingera caerulea]UWQ53187.1 hypothetical protein K3721_14415 [Leisingera caerulea]